MREKSTYKKILCLSFIAFSMAFATSFAQVATSSTTTIPEESPVEVYLPMDKQDFLLYYGVTTDEEVNTKIVSLREDFIEKVQTLKDEYQSSLQDIIKEREIIPPVYIEQEVEPKEEKILNTTISKKSDPSTKVSATSKYTLSSKKEISIAPIISISNPKVTPYTENSSWFQKIKAWFKW